MKSTFLSQLSNKTKMLIVALMIIVGVIIWAEQPVSITTTGTVSDLSADAPVFAVNTHGLLSNLKGQTVTVSDYIGAPLVINSWATWCPFCKQELPDFIAAADAYPDVQFIAINREESADLVNKYMAGENINPGRMLFWQDPTDSFYRSINGFGMPETIFVNPAGEVVTHKRGFVTADQLSVLMTEFLATF